MILHITKKLAEKLKINVTSEMAAVDEFHSWRANYVQEQGFRFVVFMNDASRFTIVINEAKAAKLKKLNELFIQTLRDTMLAFGINPEVAERYIAEMGEIAFSKNSDRKKTAQLNKCVESSWWCVENLTGDFEISVHANKIGFYNFTGEGEPFKPEERMVELLGRYGLPVRKCRAFDLEVRLNLASKDCIRRLRVPASISFMQLHELLQKAFEWHNYHLFYFGILKKDKKGYRTDPVVELVTEIEQREECGSNTRTKPMTGVKLSDYLPEYKKILYVYDYGDDWRSIVSVVNVIDNCEEELPILLSGEGDSPPEDVGGLAGFADFQEIISNPEHEEYEDTIAWAKKQWWSPFDFEKAARWFKF
jgi:hypothetical protein